MADAQVTDNAELHRFELDLDGRRAELAYVLDGTDLVLVHTEVPKALGGRGLGGVLVRAAVDRAISEGLTIVPTCPFARGWLEKHPDVAATVAVDWPDQDA